MQHKITTLLIAVIVAMGVNAQSGLDSLRVMFDSLNPANIPSHILLERSGYTHGAGYNPFLFNGSFAAPTPPDSADMRWRP